MSTNAPLTLSPSILKGPYNGNNFAKIFHIARLCFNLLSFQFLLRYFCFGILVCISRKYLWVTVVFMLMYDFRIFMRKFGMSSRIQNFNVVLTVHKNIGTI